MKRLLLIPAFSLVYLIVVSCNNNRSDKDKMQDLIVHHWDNAHFPRIDTITVGLKSDSGKYTLIKYYIKRISKDEFMIEGSADNKIGNENWKVVTMGETMP